MHIATFLFLVFPMLTLGCTGPTPVPLELGPPPAALAPQEGRAPDHGPWNALLQKHVDANGMVDYGGFAKDPGLDEYLAVLSASRPSDKWSRNERLAFWINVYNAFTIKLMVDNPGVASIKDIRAPWKTKFFRIGGREMDLDATEHVELREKLNEPRIHFAIVCASFSCPQLWNKAFTADGLDQQLDAAAGRFINDPKRNQLGDEPRLSKIFDWFEGDFTKKGSLIEFVNAYAKKRIPTDAKVQYLDYDWRLNGTR
jgi:hypothetical protein